MDDMLTREVFAEGRFVGLKKEALLRLSQLLTKFRAQQRSTVIHQHRSDYYAGRRGCFIISKQLRSAILTYLQVRSAVRLRIERCALVTEVVPDKLPYPGIAGSRIG